MRDAPATLKLVALGAKSMATVAAVRRDLEGLADDELSLIGRNAFVVHTSLTASELRDRVEATLADSDSVIVVEFETWSGYGPKVDSVWLMRRGH